MDKNKSTTLIQSKDGEQGPSPEYSRATNVLRFFGLPGILIVILFLSPLTATLLPILILPTILLISHNNARPKDERTDRETLLWTWILTGIVGVGIVIIIQSAVSCAIAALLFGRDLDAYLTEFAKSEHDLAGADAEHLAARKEMAYRREYWTSMVLLAFIIAGLMEEALKYTALVTARRFGRVVTERDYIVIVIAAALGFSFFENVGFVYAETSQGSVEVRKLALTVLERVVFGTTHFMNAALIGVSVVQRDVRSRKDLSVARVLAVPTFFHGLFNLSLFSISALNGNVGWIHPRGAWLYVTLGVASSIVAVLGFVLRRNLDSIGFGKAKFE